MKVIIINGFPESGKDTFIKLCKRHYEFCVNYSSVEFIKEFALKCGWDGEKTPKDRAFLSDLKKLLIEWRDAPYELTAKKIRALYTQEKYMIDSVEFLFFVHCREPEEIKKFVERLGAKALIIRKPDVENIEQSNSSDADIFNYTYDYTIYNDGTKEELEEKAIEFLKELGFTKLRQINN